MNNLLNLLAARLHSPAVKSHITKLTRTVAVVAAASLMICGLRYSSEAADLNGDGLDDAVFADVDNDGVWDCYETDSDGDGYHDHIDDFAGPGLLSSPGNAIVQAPIPTGYFNLNAKAVSGLCPGCIVSLDGGITWSAPVSGKDYILSDAEYEKLAGGALICVRQKAYGYYNADSDIRYINVAAGDVPPVKKPEPTSAVKASARSMPFCSFDPQNGSLTNIPANSYYSLDGGKSWNGPVSGAVTDLNVDPDLDIKVYSASRGANELPSDIQTIWVGKSDRPTSAAPINVSVSHGTGSIYNVTDREEYRRVGSDTWISIDGNTVTGLAPGDYEVRIRAYDNYLASDIVKVTIDPFPGDPQEQIVPIISVPVAVNAYHSNGARTKAAVVLQDDRNTENDFDEATVVEDEPDSDGDEVSVDVACEEIADNDISDIGDDGENADESENTDEIDALSEEELSRIADQLEGAVPAETNTDDTQKDGEPSLVGAPNIMGWGMIGSQMDSKPITIDMTDSSGVIPATVLQNAKSTGTQLALNVTPDMTWSIQPTLIEDTSKDIDFGINESNTDISDAAIASIESEGEIHKTFKVLNDGELGVKALLTVELPDASEGDTVKLYSYDSETDSMTMTGDSKVNMYNEATFSVSDSGSYALVVEADELAEAESNNVAEVTTKSFSDRMSEIPYWIKVALVALAASLLIILCIVLRRLIIESKIYKHLLELLEQWKERFFRRRR